tara:strand:- start:164 stop:1450 length:1287 start_codon:yes stop_codon:yes gene_type:complete
MTINSRRTSLRKSSESIKNIRNTLQIFAKSIKTLRIKSNEIIKQQKKSNDFKKRLISNDTLFFRKRQEIFRRKQREDELEAKNIAGKPNRQGNIIQRSTKGLLGRILDFLGILLVGWAINNLPKIIKGIQGVIKRIQKVVDILKGFLKNIETFLTGVKEGVDKTFEAFKKVNFLQNKKELEEKFDQSNDRLNKLNRDFITSINAFLDDKNIQKTGDFLEEADAIRTPTEQDIKAIEAIDNFISGSDDKDEEPEQIALTPIDTSVGSEDVVRTIDNSNQMIASSNNSNLDEQESNIGEEVDMAQLLADEIKNRNIDKQLNIKPKNNFSTSLVSFLNPTMKNDSFSSDESMVNSVDNNMVASLNIDAIKVDKPDVKGKLNKKNTIFILSNNNNQVANVSNSESKSSPIIINSKSSSRTLYELQSNTLKYT